MTTNTEIDPAYKAYEDKVKLNETKFLLNKIGYICVAQYQMHTTPNTSKDDFFKFFKDYGKDLIKEIDNGAITQITLTDIKTQYNFDYFNFKIAVQEHINSLNDRLHLNYKESFKNVVADKQLKAYLSDFCRADASSFSDKYILCGEEFISFAMSFDFE